MISSGRVNLTSLNSSRHISRAVFFDTSRCCRTASPTWLANNQVKFSGIDAETIKKNFCSANPGLDGCENTLSGDSGAPAGSC